MVMGMNFHERERVKLCHPGGRANVLDSNVQQSKDFPNQTEKTEFNWE